MYREKRIPMIALWCHHSVIKADFLMPETQQPIIVIILIIYSSHFLKVLVEPQEYIAPRILNLYRNRHIMLYTIHTCT